MTVVAVDQTSVQELVFKAFENLNLSVYTDRQQVRTTD